MIPAGFVTINDEIKEIRNSLLKPQQLISFGITFLDDALLGISKEDLIVLAGGSGGGKTELAVHIALTAAKANFRVRFLALEAYKTEITSRMVFKRLSMRFFADKKTIGSIEKPSFDKWSIGRQNHLFKDYEDEWNAFEDITNNLLLTYPGSEYGIEDFEKDLIKNKGEVDLYLLDHLHFLNLGEDESNLAYKKTVKKIKSLVNEYGVPVILLSHVRKTDRSAPTLCPDQEDIHGSSDIVKTSTKTITIASASDYIDAVDKATYPTFMRVAKNRKNGSTMRAIAVVPFNFKTNSYESTYGLGKQLSSNRQISFKPFSVTELPDWAVNAKKGF